jgi:hypothetical protein
MSCLSPLTGVTSTDTYGRPDDHPSDVVQFVNEAVDSIEQLDLLVMLIESLDRWWDAVSAGRAHGINPGSMQRDLERLATRNLLAVNLRKDVSYRFEPGSPTLRATSQAFAAAYRQNPRAVFRLAVERQKRAVRDFAEAFRIRRETSGALLTAKRGAW